MNIIKYRVIPIAIALILLLAFAAIISNDIKRRDSRQSESSEQEEELESDGQSKTDVRGILTVTCIDVGQGDATLIEYESNGEIHAMLIDGGYPEESSKIYSILEKRGIDHLDYMIATHEHADHCGGLSGALQYASVDHVYAPVLESELVPYQIFCENLASNGLRIEFPPVGDTITLGDARVAFLGPIDGSEGMENPNNTSIVVKVTFGDTSFLFMADAEREEIEAMIEADEDLSCDVIRTGHHGSDNATTYPLLYLAKAEYAVISCGNGNEYGHPHEGALSKILQAGMKLYRTDLQGDIIFKSDGQNIEVSTEKETDSISLWKPGTF